MEPRRRSANRFSYAAMAAALAIEKPHTAQAFDQWTRIVMSLADVLGAGNPKFNRKRFLLAAGAL